MLLFIAVLLASCGKESTTTEKDNSNPILVKISPVTDDGQNPFITVNGKIEASNSANLSTRMMGFVDKIHVRVGDKVKKGQLLVSINNTDLQAKRAQINAGINEANAAYNSAQKDYNRFKNLFSNQSASQKELDDMTANYEMAKARLESANQMKNEINAQFSYSNITAPFNGVITNTFIDEGVMAAPGIPLIAIESPGQFEVQTMVPENEISQISLETQVEVLVKSINKVIVGKVTEVSASAKNTGGQFLIKIALEKPDSQVLSGMFATVKIPVAKTSNLDLVLISKDALVSRGQLSGVYTVSQSNTALLRWLRLGRSYGDKVEVLSGLNAQESYIISSDSKLYNGAKIIIQ